MNTAVLTPLLGALALGICANAWGVPKRPSDAWTHYRKTTVYRYGVEELPVIALYRQFNEGPYFNRPIAHSASQVYSSGAFYNYTLKEPSLYRTGPSSFSGFSYKRRRKARQETPAFDDKDAHLFQIKGSQYLSIVAFNLQTAAFYPHNNVEVHIKCKRLTAEEYEGPRGQLRALRQFVASVPATASLTGYFPEFAVKLGELTLHEQAGELTFDSAADLRRRIGTILESAFKQRFATYLEFNTAFPHIYACQVPLDYIPSDRSV